MEVERRDEMVPFGRNHLREAYYELRLLTLVSILRPVDG